MKRTKDQELYQEIASLLIGSAPEEATKTISSKVNGDELVLPIHWQLLCYFVLVVVVNN